MSERRFEFVEGTSSKFWEIWIVGNEVRTAYGKTGTSGQTTIKDEGSAEAATKLYEKLVKEKTKKGYAEVGGAPASAASTSEAKAASAPAKFDAKPYAAAIAKITVAAKKSGFTLPKGASASAIQATEKTLGVTFPPEVRAFYVTHDGGSDDEAYNCNSRVLLSLDGIVSQWSIWKQLFDGGAFTGNQAKPSVGIQNTWWIPEWIPMTYDGAGNHDVLDLSPAEGGKLGQMMSFWHDDASRTLKAPDFLSWLATVEWTRDEDEDFDDEEDEGEGGWKRFEMDEKFWAIKLDGASHTVRYGKIGPSGQEKTKDFDDEAAAKKDHDKLVQEKTKKGYEPVDA